MADAKPSPEPGTVKHFKECEESTQVSLLSGAASGRRVRDRTINHGCC